jgi:hypothetical protein
MIGKHEKAKSEKVIQYLEIVLLLHEPSICLTHSISCTHFEYV